MQKYLFLYAVAVTALLVVGTRHHRTENRRLVANQEALASETEYFRNRLDEAAAEVQALRLTAAEFRSLRAADAARIRDLGIRLRRAEASAQSATEQLLRLAAPVRDSVVIRRRDTLLIRDTVRLFRWQDPWTTVEGCIRHDSVQCRIKSVDTLRQVVYRIPRRFLFFRWGTKALRQQVSSSNPHTRIVATEYIRIER